MFFHSSILVKLSGGRWEKLQDKDRTNKVYYLVFTLKHFLLSSPAKFWRTGELFEIPRRLCLFWEVMFLSCYTEPWAEFSFIIVKVKTHYCHVYCWRVTLWQVPLCFYYFISYPALLNLQQTTTDLTGSKCKNIKFPGWRWCDVGSAW